MVAQEALGISRGTIRATVLIETILAAFEMDEILWELREHSAGLNCGRWDYIFSFIKKFRNRPECVLPDRAKVTMTSHFLASYVELLIATCHRRGAHAMGGMAAQIPIKNDPEANEAALERVRRTNCARSGPGTTAPGWRIPGWSRWPRRCSTPTCRTPIRCDRQTSSSRHRGGSAAVRPPGRSPRQACR